ncbi:hypothetical protein ACIFOE_04800 [Paenibacillus sp. NRS-1783]|uniref:hypothetical protein n=1 Tax=Paenibacillus sp. NRS-1783 TaxID=3233907 RepID=UPI003D29489E
MNNSALVHEYNEILVNEYVGDTVEFLNDDGVWNVKVLGRHEKLGLYVKHRGYDVPVTHWGRDAVITRVKWDKNVPCIKR